MFLTLYDFIRVEKMMNISVEMVEIIGSDSSSLGLNKSQIDSMVRFMLLGGALKIYQKSIN